MIENEIVPLISSVGFPIVVSLWFMFRTEKIFKANTEVLNRILEKI